MKYLAQRILGTRTLNEVFRQYTLGYCVIHALRPSGKMLTGTGLYIGFRGSSHGNSLRRC